MINRRGSRGEPVEVWIGVAVAPLGVLVDDGHDSGHRRSRCGRAANRMHCASLIDLIAIVKGAAERDVGKITMVLAAGARVFSGHAAAGLPGGSGVETAHATAAGKQTVAGGQRAGVAAFVPHQLRNVSPGGGLIRIVGLVPIGGWRGHIVELCATHGDVVRGGGEAVHD